MPGNWDRLNCRAVFPSSNEWGIPDLEPTKWIPARLVAYNSRAEIAAASGNAAVHFFLDDYRFETVWTKPERGLSRIAQVGAALTPDFSLWREMPLAMQLWQVYRSRWCGCWLAEHGIEVIPTVSWSTPESFEFAFLGVGVGSVVAVSTVGIRGELAWRLFAAGYAEMVRRLSPSFVLIYGRTPPEQVSALRDFRIYGTRWGLMGGRGGSSGANPDYRVQDRVVEATQAIAHRPGAQVRLATLRDRLTAFGRDEVDKALIQLAKAGRIHLIQEDNQKELTAADRRAAIRFGDRTNHKVSIR